MQRFSGSLPFSISFLPASLYIISIYNNQKIITRENLSKIDRNATEKSRSRWNPSNCQLYLLPAVSFPELFWRLPGTIILSLSWFFPQDLCSLAFFWLNKEARTLLDQTERTLRRGDLYGVRKFQEIFLKNELTLYIFSDKTNYVFVVIFCKKCTKLYKKQRKN